MQVLVARGRRFSLLLVRERSRELLFMRVPESRPSGLGTDQSCRSGWADGVLPLLAARAHEEGLPPETGIPGFRDNTILVNDRTREDTVYSSTP